MTNVVAAAGQDSATLQRNGPTDGPASASSPNPSGSGSILTGKQEHCRLRFAIDNDDIPKLTTQDLKRELIARQTEHEITELSNPTALQRFGHPFRSEAGEVPPEDSELPLLRYIFVHHVRNFPFLDQAREKEFWQDKLQVVCQDSTHDKGCLSALLIERLRWISSSNLSRVDTSRHPKID